MKDFDLKKALKKVLKKLHTSGTFWIARPTLDQLKAIRTFELDVVLKMLPAEGKCLEIGAGTGWQAQALASHGYDVSAIDLPSSNYLEHQIWPIVPYDGRTIPFEDGIFNIVYSSNVLEHIPHVYEFQKEIRRVLAPEGYVIHVLPSSSWRLWTNMTHLLKCWNRPTRHGELAGNAWTEICYFSKRWWSRLFRNTGWVIDCQKSNGLFYTGHSIMDSRLSIRTRSRLSRVLGSSCNIFVLRKSPTIAMTARTVGSQLEGK